MPTPPDLPISGEPDPPDPARAARASALKQAGTRIALDLPGEARTILGSAEVATLVTELLVRVLESCRTRDPEQLQAAASAALGDRFGWSSNRRAVKKAAADVVRERYGRRKDIGRRVFDDLRAALVQETLRAAAAADVREIDRARQEVLGQ